MAEKEPSAEKQLLNLIESGSGQDASKEASHAGGAIGSVGKKPPVYSIDVIRGRVAYWQEICRGFFQGKDLSFSLDIFNNALLGLMLCLAAYLGIFALVQSGGRKHLLGLTAPEFSKSQEKTAFESLMNPELLKEKIRLRDLFSPKPETKSEEVKMEQGPSVDDLVKDLRLVGISYSPATNESYVMVENIKTELTYILQEGDTIANFVIEQILSDKVVMRIGGETVELK